MTHTHLIFVVLLLLLFSPSLLCSDAEAKIYRGDKVGPDQVNYGVVSIYLSVYETKDGILANVSRLCGGSAIKPFAILTSLYCMNLYESKEWKEGSGHNITVSFTNYRMEPYSLSFDKITVINHDSFYDPEKNKTSSLKIIDMALVFLPKNLTVRYTHVGSTELGRGVTLYPQGWGRTSKDRNSFQTHLMNTVTYRAAGLSECDNNWPIYDKGYTEKNYICVDSRGSGPCEGDYGGPVLWLPDKILVGILIKTSENSCDGTTPVKFFPVVKVSQFKTWIDANLKKYVPSPRSGSSSGLIFSPVLLGLSALVSLFLL